MWKIAAGLAAMALVALVALNIGERSTPASAGIIPLPPGGLDEFDINAEFSIDLGQGPEVVSLAGNMAVSRDEPDPTAGTIDTEIVALSLTGTSNLLEPGTPVLVQLSEVEPAFGQIGPAEGFPADSFFDVFFDIKIGEFQHYTQQPTQISGLYSGVPPYDSKWLSGPMENPIVDATDANHIPGFLLDATIWGKPPVKTYTISVLKQHADTKAGLPGWEMNIYTGAGCNGRPFDTAVTGEDGLADFLGLAAGTYSVQEKMQPGWNNVTPLCQDTTVPGGAGVAGVPACPIQPDMPPPAAGCDEFNSAASVKVQFTNPPSAPLDCDLGGPTLITRGAVVPDVLDSIQTEIVAMNLTGTCAGAANVTVRESSTLQSLGKITEQQNNERGVLEFSADSFFDVFFDVETPIGTLHNQDPLHLECKINEIPPYGCVYEPDVGSLLLYDDAGKEVGKLIHAAHIPLDPKQKLLIFVNAPKLTPTPTPTPATIATDTPTPATGATVTPTPATGATVTPTPATDATDTPTPTHTQTSPTDTPVPTDEPGGDGDANKDGTVDSRDALLVLQWVAGRFTGPLTNSDTDTSGAVDARDAALILQFVAGFLQDLPV